MVQEIALYESSATNAQINASSAETFFAAANDKQHQIKNNQSFNNLEIVNDSSNDLTIDLDGLSTRRRTLFAKSALVIKAEQGIFFTNLKITNKSSTAAVSASAINLIARIVKFAASGA